MQAAWLRARRPPSRRAPAWLSPGPDLVQQIGVPVGGNSGTCYETPNTTSLWPRGSRSARAAWLKARPPPSKHAPAWLSPGPDLVQQIGVPV